MPVPDSNPETSLDRLVCQYLEAHGRSVDEARRFLEDHRREASDQGRALESILQKLSEVGLPREMEVLRGSIAGGSSIERRSARVRAPGSLEQARRWFRAHPARATAAVTLGIALVVAPASYGALQQARARETGRLNVELKRSLAAAAAAEEEATVAAEKALEAIESQLRRVAKLGLEDTPGGIEIRRQLVEDAFQLIEEIPTVPRLVHARSVVECSLLRTRGDLLRTMGDETGALEVYRRLEKRLRENLLARPDDVGTRAELGTLLAQRAATLSDLGRATETAALYDEGLPLIEGALREGWRPGIGDATHAMVRVHRILDAFDAGQIVEAEAQAHGLIAEIEAWPDEVRSLPNARMALAESYRVTAQAAASRRAFEQAIQAEERGAELLEAVLKVRPRHRRATYRLAETWRRQALDWMQRGDSRTASALLERCSASYRELSELYPEWREATLAAGNILALRAQLASTSGDGEKALELTAQVVENWRTRPESDPLRLAGLAMALGNAANNVTLFAPEDEERLREGVAMATEAMAIFDDSPSQEIDRTAYWMFCYNRSVLRSKLGEVDGARSDLEEVMRLTEGNAANQAMVQRYLADAWCELYAGYRSKGAGETDTAAFAKEQIYVHLERAVARGYADKNDLSTHEGLAAMRTEARFQALLAGLE
ncbi:hypothetical protein Poly30_42540 [Planctomycetes bacterium Poly30]|uniref:Tetratricopeptide repeat protein n=1 Tax=Saltatorellus ferox TaxID=2528018 RepID=A0A518EXA5_9BACT|nr:hypothetical protein Poly30_42540 [Planctomycetes bacterium Poly30]